MNAISIQRSSATLVILGIKPVENRNWSSSYRGPLLIHASKKWDKEGAEFILDRHPELKEIINNSKNQRGVILGKVTMVDCVTQHDSEWFFGPYGFIFIQPWEFYKPIPFKGQLGLFNIPDSVIKEII